ncbi:tyrosine-type recombinase/integrase [Maritalea porphyrae]|uniref:tyrosine-type recombinase/integrase n=1 Tax=Maritalea porphyrae TaxID=880732 RepID=UPI0022B057F0|nr:hypothetical protein [Maritalea porphyrae]MCZ4272023.1 hypothetical protein [Maritalea porphyrae]
MGIDDSTDANKQWDVLGNGRLILQLRPDVKKKIYQVRIRVPNASGYKHLSTKTEDKGEAERFARAKYEELYMHILAGGSIKSRSFLQVFNEWEKHTQTAGPNRQGGSWNETLERVRKYALPYFGNKKIQAITSADFIEFWDWRKANYAKIKPSNATLRRENTCILPLFKFALNRGYVKAIPPTNPPKAAQKRRPTFNLVEWKKITAAMMKWGKAPKSPRIVRYRFVAHQFFLLMANSGLRVGEARDLKWQHIRSTGDGVDKRIVAEVAGKTGFREVVFQPGSEVFFRRLYDLETEETDAAPNIDRYIFSHSDGKQIESFRKSFQSLLTFADVPIEKQGNNRTIYSLRHFYATQRLTNGLNPFLLAKQMGTSVEMLEKHYGQIVNSELASQISKGNQTTSLTATSTKYPFD